jgi:hypothetical protein
MNNIKRGQIAQKIYSAQSCLKVSNSQTEHYMRDKKKETGFHWKIVTIRSPIDDCYLMLMRVLFLLERETIRVKCLRWNKISGKHRTGIV